MTMIPCELIQAGDRVHVDALNHEPIRVTRVEVEGQQVFLYEGTATVITMFKGSVVERLD